LTGDDLVQSKESRAQNHANMSELASKVTTKTVIMLRLPVRESMKEGWTKQLSAPSPIIDRR
jgi:hypothetical protein